MMQKRILFLLCSLLTTSAFTQLSPKFNGLSATTGNLHPDGPNYGVTLQNQLIQVRELDSVVKYDIVYEFKNTSAQFCTVNATMPVNLYFNEFAYGKRTPMLDQLAAMPTFADLFKVQDQAGDIREQIRDNFQQRLFIRRYINIDNLKQLGIFVDVFRNNTRVNIKKILCEIKFHDEDPLNQQKDTEVLSMEIKFMIDMNFQPGEATNMMVFVTMPTVKCGIDQTEIYTPYQLGYEKNWSGAIQKFYMQHDVFTSTPILPRRMSDYQQKFHNERDQVLIFNNITPADKEWVAFYHLADKNICNNQGMFAEQVIIPSPIKNISASSWVKSSSELAKRSLMSTPVVAFSDSITIYQTGNPTKLDLFSKNFSSTDYSNAGLYNYISTECKQGQPSIILKETGNPVFAFDITDFFDLDSSYTGVENLGKQTCWCESNATTGTGEYIQFELTQPAMRMKIFNGNLLNRKIFDESSKVDIMKITSVDGYILDKKANKSEIKYSVIDLAIMNVYEMRMEPGTYRITIDAVDAGKTPVTCFSSIMFDFVLEDEWFQKSTSILESFFGKTN